MFGREKRLSRSDLLELVVQLSEENDALREENGELRERLEDKDIVIGESGSIAEAALRLSGVFEAAQRAADTYLENIRNPHAEEDEGGSRGREVAKEIPLNRSSSASEEPGRSAATSPDAAEGTTAGLGSSMGVTAQHSPVPARGSSLGQGGGARWAARLSR